MTGLRDAEVSLLETAPCGFAVFADDGIVRYANATLLEMLGLARDAVVGHHVEKLMSVGSRIFYQTHLFPLLRMQHRAEEIFIALRSANGQEVGALLNATRRERGGEWLTECVVIRVRERQKFEDALLPAKKQAEEARAEAESRRADLQQANEILEQQAVELEVSQQQLSEQAAELETQQESLQALNDQLMQRSADLEKQREIADEANRAKSAFLASMSHELRTPLNAIGGYVQLLAMGIHGPVTPAQAETLEKVTRSQRHLLRLINEVLNLARIEAGRVNYDIERAVVRDIVNAVTPMVEPQLAEKQLTLSADVPASLAVMTDRDKAEQILLNLLGNALKITRSGGRVTVRASPDVAPDRTRIEVIDTGIGIPPNRLQEIFEPFVQVDVSAAGAARGTGLGLAISRDLARGMGGDLSATSVLDEGSTFVLTLPSA
ncbi:MAG: ATP-binding protein [Gemmatimonadaceae bacterium]